MISGCFALPQRSSDCLPADGRPLPRAQNFIRFASSNSPVQDLRISPIHIAVATTGSCRNRIAKQRESHFESADVISRWGEKVLDGEHLHSRGDARGSVRERAGVCERQFPCSVGIDLRHTFEHVQRRTDARMCESI